MENPQSVDNIDLAQVEADVRKEWAVYSQRPNAHLISRATEYPVLLAMFDEIRRLRAAVAYGFE